MQLPDGPRWEHQDEYIRNNVEQTGDESAQVVVQTFAIGYERIPKRFSRGTGEDGEKSADGIKYSSSKNNNPSTIPHERRHRLLRGE